MSKNKVLAFLGITTQKIDLKEGVIAGLGGFLGIAGVYLVSRIFIADDMAAFFIVASMGSSAVLLFSAPHSSLTQPWNLLAGHLIAAIVGVSCAKYFSMEIIAAAMSVGVTMSLTHFARCIHPPAGATTIYAVIGGSHVQEIGYLYVFAPVLINTFVIFAVAVLFNALFSWRRYPRYLGEG
jgi:CBS domain-containing membrane protein